MIGLGTMIGLLCCGEVAVDKAGLAVCTATDNGTTTDGECGLT